MANISDFVSKLKGGEILISSKLRCLSHFAQVGGETEAMVSYVVQQHC